MNDLELYQANVASAIRALEMAARTGDINERFRCLNQARLHEIEAHKNLCGWRGNTDKPAGTP